MRNIYKSFLSEFTVDCCDFLVDIEHDLMSLNLSSIFYFCGFTDLKPVRENILVIEQLSRKVYICMQIEYKNYQDDLMICLMNYFLAEREIKFL